MAVSFEILNNLQVQGVLTVSSISSSGLSLQLQSQSGNVLIGNAGNLANTNGALIAAGAGVFKGGLGATPSGKYIACEVSLSQCIISAKNGPDLEKMYYNASEHVFTNYPIVCTTLLGLPLLQLNLVNTSTGTNASSIFRFNVGTSTATLQAYNNTHSTFASQLRVSTSAGNIVIIPSGTTSTTFNSSTVTISPTTASESISTGALVVNGGVGVGGTIWCGNLETVGYTSFYNNFYCYAAAYLEGNVEITSSTASTSTSTGALVVSGGVGIAGSLYVGGSVLNLTNVNTGQTVLTVTNTSNGATAGASLNTSNGTSGLKITTWSSTYSGRTNQSWIYTTNTHALKLGTNNEAWLSILSSGVVQVLSDVDGTNGTGALMLEGGMFVGKSIYCLESLTCSSISTNGAILGGSIYLNTDATINGNAIIGSDIKLGNSTGPSVPATLSSRAPRQGLAFDGTAEVTVASVPAFATGDFTVVAWVNPTAIGSTQYIFSGASGAFGLRLNNNGTFQSTKMGDADNSPSAGSLVAGKNTFIVYSRSGDVGTYYINGKQLPGGGTADTKNYTTAISVIGKNGLASQDYWNGTISGSIIYNRALSLAEIVALYESGVPAVYDLGTAGSIAPSNTALTTSIAAQNFAYDTFTSTTNSFSAIETGGQACEANFISGTTFLGKAPRGARFLVQFTATLTSGAIPSVRLSTQAVAGVSSAIVNIVNGSNSIILQLTEPFTAETGTGAGRITFASGSNTNYSISNLVVTKLGAALAPDATQTGGGFIWYDTSGNSANITIPATGVKWNVPTSGKINSTFSITNTTQSISYSTGALTVSGGLGVGGAIYSNDIITGLGLVINGAAGTNRSLRWQTSGVDRWVLNTSSGAESGSDAGSNFFLDHYSDAGIYLGTAFAVTRSTGNATFYGSALALTKVTVGETIFTVTNTSNNNTSGATISTSNGTSGLKVTTWSSTYAGRASQSWIYTTTGQSLKLGTNNTAWLSILSTGVVQVLSDVDGTNSTGALMIEGGMFVGKSIYCLENITCVSNLDCGNISSNGDLSVLGSATIGGDINFISSTGPSVLSALSSKSPRQGLVFDGTAGATVTSVSAFQTNTFAVAIWVNPKAIGSTQYLFSGASGAFNLVLLSNGRIQSGKMGGANNSASAYDITAGKNTLIIYNRIGNAGIYYINGANAGYTVDAQDYTAPVSVIGKHGSASQDYLKGSIFGNIIYNRALSFEEIKALYETGVPEAADYNNAGTTLNTANFTDVGGGSTLSGNSSAGVTVVRASGSSYIAVRNGGISARPGQRFRLSGTLTLNAGKTVVPVAYVDGTSSAQVSLAAGAFSIEIVTPASGGTVNGIIISGNGDQNWTLSNFSAISLGVVLAPDAAQAGSGLTWYDTSGKFADISIPATGVKWNVVTSEKINSLETSGTLTSNGNFYCYNHGYIEGDLNVQAGITAIAGLYAQERIKTDSYLAMSDGIFAPDTEAGYARIYIDSADGDLKIKFGDGTVKTIVTDT